MKFTLSRSILREVLQGLGRVVQSRATLPVLQCMKIEAEGGRVRVSGTNLDQYVTCQPECAVERPGACIVQIERLKPFAKGGDKDVLTLDATKDSLTVTSPVHGQGIPHTIPTGDPAEWPAFAPEVATSPAPESFLARLQAILPFASQDESRKVLNSVYLEKAEGVGRMIATDGRRLTCFDVGELPIAESVILPSCRFLSWSRLADPAGLGLLTGKDTRWIKLTSGTWSFWARAVDGTYPNWRHVIPDGGGKTKFTLADEDVELLRKAMPTFPGHDADQPSIRIAGKSGRLCVLGRGRDDKTPTALDLPASKAEGGDMQVAVDRRFLLDALDAGFRQFTMADAMGPLLARCGSGLHVLMPMRVSAESVPDPKPQTAPPAAEPQPMKKEIPMPEKTHEPGALDRLIAAFDAAKAKVREANDALAQVAGAIKDAIREDKQRRAEIDTVRAGLLKLQAIRV